MSNDTKKPHGGARHGGGRPVIGELRRNIVLTAADEDWLRAIGAGSLSKGIAEAVRRLRGG